MPDHVLIDSCQVELLLQLHVWGPISRMGAPKLSRGPLVVARDFVLDFAVQYGIDGLEEDLF